MRRPDVPPRQYVGGESHRYLGRQYRLKIEAGSNENVKLTRQFLIVETSDRQSAHVKALVEAWYQAQAAQVFAERLQACYTKLRRFAIPLPRLAIRKMSASWGNCSPAGTISLNIKLIQAPPEYIDYVLTRELCHLKHLHHGSEFYRLLDRALPDWKTKQEKPNRFDFG